MSYSPFFTSGLLSSPSTSAPWHIPPAPVARRGSLPANESPSSPTLASEESHTAFYFTLQARRKTAELRSFLSLDLAESSSIRSASIRRKDSSVSRSTGRVTSSRFSKCAPSSFVLPYLGESARSIPTAKPAPRVMLPSLPPQLPPIDRTPRLTLSPPELPKPTVNTTRRNVRPPSTLCLRTVSTASNFHPGGRTDALACLEGRSTAADRIPRKAVLRNFINLEEDEDDEEEEEVDASEKATIASYYFGDEQDENVLPSPAFSLPSRASCRTFESIPQSSHHIRDSWFLSGFVVHDAKSEFFDFSTTPTIQSREEDMSTWSWRSFIEIASAA